MSHNKFNCVKLFINNKLYGIFESEIKAKNFYWILDEVIKITDVKIEEFYIEGLVFNPTESNII